MLKHHFVLIYRSTVKYRGTFFINLIGLSTGIACVLIIYLWVNDELNFDRFHVKDNRLYQVMVNEQRDDRINTLEGTGGILGETLAKEMPEIEFAAAMTPPEWFQNFTISTEKVDVTSKGNFVSKHYFNIFSYDLIEGDKERLLADKNSIVISESLARNLFNTTEDVVGKTVEWKWLVIKKQSVITGVYKDTPANFTHRFGFVLSFEIWKELVPATGELGYGPFHTFLTLNERADPAHFNDKIKNFIKEKQPESNCELFARRYSDGYLYGNYENGVQSGGRIENVRLFSIIAVFILLIACVNFMNLSTAKSTTKMKEVGIKKAIGANRRSLILHYFGESLMTSFMALVVGLLLTWVALPFFNEVTSKELTLAFDSKSILAIFIITFLTGLISGSYPALYLSGFEPILVLRGKNQTSRAELLARQGLVIFQFIITVIFIASVIIVSKQIQFIQAMDPGYDRDNVVYFEIDGKVGENVNVFLSEVKSIPGIVNASSIQQKILLTSTPESGVEWEGKNADDKVRFYQIPVNYDMIETLGIEIKEGRAFSKEFSTDSSGIIFNEAAIEAMDLRDPIGKNVTVWGGPRQVIGVAKDFHFQSIHEPVKPFFFILAPERTMIIMARIQRGHERQTIADLKKLYNSFNSDFVFNYKFLNDDYNAQYASENNVAVLSKYFAGLAILISCLGLFGLIAFTAEKRLKEIGIRKAFGATHVEIIYLLSRDFTKVVILSIVVALPISYLLAKQWLENFVYRIQLEFIYFAAAGILALLICWFIVAAQTIKASVVNTITCLKDE